MLSVIGFLVILAPLVIVHEFGHFFFAKIFGVKAEAFSVGFGPKLYAKYIGETEFRLSAIPLGGYVKLLGEDPSAELSPEDKKRALQHQVPWKRFFIFFGGPLFNFLFAIIVFMAILAIGEPQVANVIGRVIPGTEAARMGFMSGDRVAKINGEEITRFTQIAQKVHESPDQELIFELLRGNQSTPHTLRVKIGSEEGFSMYGETKAVGKIDGLVALPRSTHLGVSNPQSPAATQGLKTGDQIREFSGQKVTSWEQIENLYQSIKAPAQIRIKAEAVDGVAKEIELSKKSNLSMAEQWGLYSSELFVEQAMKDSPALKAGVARGDRLIGIDGIAVTSFEELREKIQTSSQKDGEVRLSWEKDGKTLSAGITPNHTQERDPNLKKVSQYTIGVVPMLMAGETQVVVDRIWNPFVLLYKGTERMFLFVWRNLVSIGKMFTGDVSISTLGGPILIGKIAGDSLSRGLISFLTTMAILSVGLGILNVLPIPVLDGGHLVLLGIEWIRGKPLSMRQMEVVQQVGLSLILLLMVVVMRNDLTRLPIFN